MILYKGLNMLINLSDVFNTVGKTLETEIPVSGYSFEGSLGSYRLLKGDAFRIKAEGIGKGRAKVSGTAHLCFAGTCDRCLKEAPVEISISFERDFASPDFKSDDEDENEEIHEFMDGFKLDSDALLYDEITVNWPVKILCREDCRGLCPVCGHDLNEGDCGCDTFVPDPRMAVLSDIFHKD